MTAATALREVVSTSWPMPTVMMTTGLAGSLTDSIRASSCCRVSPAGSSFLPSVSRMTELTRLGTYEATIFSYAANRLS